ncbi:MAG TPA: VOC family protein [Nocardioidaceae bacterium]|nr:VOC family protein [Nocardioidaceae bacterium]
MVCFVSHTSVDCRNAFALSEWWKALLGYVDIEDDPNLPGHEECLIQDQETGHRILFIEVPDEKQAKNRLHLDLRPRESSRDEEVDRLISLGTTVVADHRDAESGSGWVVFADPEGNEFCVLRSQEELAAAR